MAPRIQIEAWRPPVAGILEVFHARFADHAYPSHTHDAWTLPILDAGAVRDDLDRRERLLGAHPTHLARHSRRMVGVGPATHARTRWA